MHLYKHPCTAPSPQSDGLPSDNVPEQAPLYRPPLRELHRAVSRTMDGWTLSEEYVLIRMLSQLGEGSLKQLIVDHLPHRTVGDAQAIW